MQQQIEYQESYTENGVMIEARVQVQQIEPLRHKLQDLTRGREQLRVLDE